MKGEPRKQDRKRKNKSYKEEEEGGGNKRMIKKTNEFGTKVAVKLVEFRGGEEEEEEMGIRQLE